MIYLASPFTHPDPAVRETRFREACRAAARLMRTGEQVFSPISHSYGIAQHGLPVDWSFWEPFDRKHIAWCDELVVRTLDGWQESEGVRAEIRIAQELGKPIRYLAPDWRPPATGQIGRSAPFRIRIPNNIEVAPTTARKNADGSGITRFKAITPKRPPR